MQLDGKKIVLTGAAGGMGAAIAAELSRRGATLLLADLDGPRLQTLAAELGSHHRIAAGDLCTDAGRNDLVSACAAMDGADVLINAAGLSDFALLNKQSTERIELQTTINLVVPMILSKLLLPVLMARPEAAIINVGSTFGSIGHPGFTTYCANKFGLHGFTQALRRELAGSPVEVFYLAPRATRTNMNSAAVVAMNKELGNAMDDPQVVVQHLVRLLESGAGRDRFIGWPERLFVRLNGLIPSLVDRAMRKQLPVILRFVG